MSVSNDVFFPGDNQALKELPIQRSSPEKPQVHYGSGLKNRKPVRVLVELNIQVGVEAIRNVGRLFSNLKYSPVVDQTIKTPLVGDGECQFSMDDI